MLINQMIENIKKYHKGYGTIDEATTRDQILYGDANQECTGVVTTCWASVDVIRFAIEKVLILLFVMKLYFGIMVIIRIGLKNLRMKCI